jgi:hypothetical protein
VADYQITLGPRPPVAPVTTLLTPAERIRVDAAGQGLYRTLHRETLDDAIRDVRERRASAVLVSVACCGDGGAATFVSEQVAERVAALVREFPRVPAVALLTELRPTTPRAVLSLGRSGVHTLVKGCTKLLHRTLPVRQFSTAASLASPDGRRCRVRPAHRLDRDRYGNTSRRTANEVGEATRTLRASEHQHRRAQPTPFTQWRRPPYWRPAPPAFTQSLALANPARPGDMSRTPR